MSEKLYSLIKFINEYKTNINHMELGNRFKYILIYKQQIEVLYV
ncbi:hypothetical protein QOZ83_16640 [Romboutsia sedimentorum]|nr:hypothetical protein [Romboutsia sedimentorum]MDK2587469.1 hypothetical protein [Romboutsia sedimentorum]